MTPLPAVLRETALFRPRLRAWGNMARSATLARLAPDRVPRPHVGYLLLTWRCNLQCRACGAGQATSDGDLTTEEWLRVFRELAPLDVVKFLGGEPFQRPDIGDLMAAAREILAPYILQVTTNGTLTDEIVSAVERVGWPGLQLRISVDGLGDTHDRMRGVEGAFARAEETLRALAPLRTRLGFRLGVNFAVTDESIGEVKDMLAFAGRHGADLIPGIPVSPFLDGSSTPAENPQRFVLIEDPARALDALQHHRAGIRRQLPRWEQVLSRALTGDVFRRQVREGALRFRCRAGRDILYMLPDGEVVTCGVDHRPLGNVRRQSLAEIWSSPEAAAVRANVDACPGCLQASIHILSRLYGGNLRG